MGAWSVDVLGGDTPMDALATFEDVLGIDRMAFGIGVALAGLAGALLAPVFLVFPTNGMVTTVKGFEIVVIGGLGSIPGALIAGLLLGLIETFGAASPGRIALGAVVRGVLA